MSVIYEPRGKAREYSPLALNLYMGCPHKCLYCYGPSCLQRKREDYFQVPEPRKNILENLKKQLEKERPTQQVLLSFIGDPYGRASDDNEVTRSVLEVFLDKKTPAAILTKGGTRCLKDMELFKRFGEHIQVGATLTLHDLEDSEKWESGAAKPEDRLDALRELHKAGIKTFASFEPVVDPEQSLMLMRDGLDIIDTFKIGKINNYGGLDKEIDWTDFLQRALRILRPAGKRIYIKHDLREAAPSIRLYGNEVLPDEHNVS